MNITVQKVGDQKSLEKFQRFLSLNNLPFSDLSATNSLLYAYYENGILIGSGGLERYGDVVLLRSLAVASTGRSRGVGRYIVQDLMAKVKEQNIHSIFLLTETAHAFFLKFGFQDISREEVPEPIKKSSEFAHVCPTSAAVMELRLS